MKLNKRNHEGYMDLTAYHAMKTIMKENPVLRYTYRPLVFICSPYAGDPVSNERKALEYCKFAVKRGRIPIAPHIYFPRFLDDTNKAERALGLFMGQVLLKKCTEVWVFGYHISSGMQVEIDKAKSCRIPIHYYDENMREVRHNG